MNPPNTTWNQRLRPLVQGFHTYAAWLVGISWKRFFVLSLLLMILASILESMPPFSWTMREVIELGRPETPHKSDRSGREPMIRIEKPDEGSDHRIDITIDERGIRVQTRPAVPPATESAASEPQGPASGATPPGPSVGEVARHEAVLTIEEPPNDAPTIRVSRVHMEDFLTDLAALWVLASVIIKLTYKGQMQAQAEAAQAAELAEAESLQRQLAEARMATMQAQVEPHFLFNTLASIEHLIETDAARAGRMQRALIDLLRATMPALREGGAIAQRTLGQERAVIEPYLAILKMRMEDRLETVVDFPAGLASAQCPPMVLQMLVENAIKHGLEPKPEGGRLEVSAAVAHGELELCVSDTGVGLAQDWQSSGGVGLRNIRERLALRYGDRARLTVQPREGGGTQVKVSLPYRVVGEAPGAASTAPADRVQDQGGVP